MANVSICLGQIANSTVHSAIQQITNQYTGQQAQQAIAAHLQNLNVARNNVATNVAAYQRAMNKFNVDKSLRMAEAIIDHDQRLGPLTGNLNGNVTDTAYSHYGNIIRAAGAPLLHLQQSWWDTFSNLVHPWREIKRGIDETELIKALSNQPTTNQAMKHIADAIHRGIDMGNVLYRDVTNMDYPKGMIPFNHIPEKTVLVPRTQWVDRHLVNVPGTNVPVIDLSMVNPRTKKPFANQAELRSFMEDVYDDIVTNGLSVHAQNPLAAHVDRPSKYLKYTPEGWFAMRSTMDDSVVSTIMNNFTHMARDIAMAQHTGLNPYQFSNFIKNELRLNVNESAANQWDHFFKTFTHTSDLQRPVNPQIAEVASALRQLTTGVYQGATAIKTVLLGDTGVIGNRLLHNHIPFTSYLKEFGRALKSGEMSNLEAIAHADRWDNRVFGLQDMGRMYGEQLFSRQTINNIVHIILGSSFLEKLTLDERLADVRTIRHALVNEADKPLQNVKQRELLERYGITSHEWDTFRATKYQIPNTNRFDFDYGKLWDSGDKTRRDIATKFKAMEISEARSSVYAEPHARVAAAVNFGQRGTIGGEIARATTQFGQWSMNFWQHNYGSPLASKLPVITKAKFVAGIFIVGVTSSALSQIFSDVIIDGKEPPPIDANFIANAILRSDVLGRNGEIIAKILGLEHPGSPRFGDVANAMEMIPSTALLAPLGRQAWNVVHGIIKTGDIESAFNKFNIPRTIVDYTRIFGSVFGAQLWYTKLAFNRLVLNELEKMLDPDGYETRQDRARSHMEEQGQGYIWAPPR